MSTSAPDLAQTPAHADSFVLTGTPVVPGVALGPVVRPSEGVRLPDGEQPVLAEESRAGEKELFRAAAELVAARLSARAASPVRARRRGPPASR